MVTCVELSQVQASSIFVESLDVLVEPDVLTSDGRDTLRFEGDSLDRVLGYKVSSRCPSLDSQLREVILVYGLLELRTRSQVYLDCFGLTIMVDGKPKDCRSWSSLSDVIFLVAGNACDCKSLCVA